MLTPASLVIRLHPNDDVVIARQQLVGGTLLVAENVKVAGLVPPGHKVAIRHDPRGRTRPPLQPDHRLREPRHRARASTSTSTTSRCGASTATTRSAPTRSRPSTCGTPAIVHGHLARDGPNAGKVATRNYLGILSTVNCSATVARAIADGIRRRARCAHFPNVDGVVALTHGTRLRDGHATARG